MKNINTVAADLLEKLNMLDMEYGEAQCAADCDAADLARLEGAFDATREALAALGFDVEPDGCGHWVFTR